MQQWQQGRNALGSPPEGLNVIQAMMTTTSLQLFGCEGRSGDADVGNETPSDDDVSDGDVSDGDVSDDAACRQRTRDPRAGSRLRRRRLGVRGSRKREN